MPDSLTKQETKPELSPDKKPTKKPAPDDPKKKPENRVTIYHEFAPLHDEHPVNRSITWINQIVRLIFKNTKDSQAITLGTGGKVELPKSKGPNEDRKFM